MHLTDKGLEEAPLHGLITSDPHVPGTWSMTCFLKHHALRGGVNLFCSFPSLSRQLQFNPSLSREVSFACFLLFAFVSFSFSVKGIETRAWLTVRKCSTTKPHLQLSWTILFRGNSSLSVFIKTRTFSTFLSWYLSSIYVINYFSILFSVNR